VITSRRSDTLDCPLMPRWCSRLQCAMSRAASWSRSISVTRMSTPAVKSLRTAGSVGESSERHHEEKSESQSLRSRGRESQESQSELEFNALLRPVAPSMCIHLSILFLPSSSVCTLCA
jgi:hypothetical protein